MERKYLLDLFGKSFVVRRSRFASLMAKTLPTKTSAPDLAASFAVIASRYNTALVDGLVGHFQKELAEIAPLITVKTYRVPGSFEIPVAVQEVLESGQFDAVTAFGVIIEGETAHAQLVAGSVTQSLQNLALEHRTPVVHEVLLVKTEEQARRRCLGKEMNRGTEAARTAVQIVEAIREIRS
jgi:6,7-dimethyl-8-ribityllumazine synthase